MSHKKILLAISLALFLIMGRMATDIEGAETSTDQLKYSKFENSKPAPIPSTVDSFLKGWKVKGHVLFGADLSNKKSDHAAEMWFDRARLDLEKEGLSFFKENDGGLRFTFETFNDKDSKKPEFYLKYIYSWVKLNKDLTLQAGYIPTPLVGPEEMGTRWLGREIGKSLVDTDLKVSSRALAAGLKYTFPIGKVYFIVGEGHYNNGNSMEGIVEVKPFESNSSSIMKNFFARAGGIYNMPADEETSSSTLALMRVGFEEKGKYSVSFMGLKTSGPASRLEKNYPGLKKNFKGMDIDNTGYEFRGQVYPWKIIGGSDKLEKVWFMARHRGLTGDFDFTQTALLAGYDMSKNITIGAGPVFTSASENSGVKDNTMTTIAIQFKF